MSDPHQDSITQDNSIGNTTPNADLPRRSFFVRAMAGFVGFIVGVVPFAAGLAFFFDPLVRKRGGGEGGNQNGFIDMEIPVSAVPDNGIPQAFKVHDDVVDAWNKFLHVEIGSVWLRKNPDGEIVAFSSVCPHLGCAVDYVSAERVFYCPCHTSKFELTGEKINDIPPRGMDTLKTKIKEGTIWIKYEKFRATIAEKVPIS